MKEDGNQQSQALDKNILEWIVFGVSIVLTAVVVGYLGYKAVTEKVTPPDIRVEYEFSPAKNAAYRYHLTVFNDGGETAEEVVIEVLLQKDGSTLEKSEVNIPFAPKDSKRESWVYFTHNPTLADTVLVRVASYSRP